MIRESEKIALQTEIFNMKANAQVSNKSAEEKESLAHEEHNIEKSNVLNECESKLEDTLKFDNSDCIIINPVSNL